MPETAISLEAISGDDGAEERRMVQDAHADSASTDPLKVVIHDTMAAAEAAWRQIEATGAVTPYQRFDWLYTMLEARRDADRARIAVAIVEATDQPVALLPLEITRRLGVAIGSLIGTNIANIGWMPVTPEGAARLTRPALDRVLGEIGRRAGGLDALSLRALIPHWHNLDNPLLAFASQPAPDHLYLGDIRDEPAQRVSSKRLSNIKRGKRRLEETLGRVRLQRAETPETVARMHQVFLEQRGARFAEQGIANLFAQDWFVRFFGNAATHSLASAAPMLRFHALYAGDEIVATSVGAYAGTHFSQYINSTTTGPAAKSSLMALLMLELLEELRSGGFTSMDMGLGDFDYKTDWTDRTVVYDAVIPLTASGQAAAALILGLRSLRRAVKQNEKLFGAFKRLRAVAAGKRS